MNHSTIQTELVACALCEADGKNPDDDVPTGEVETVWISADEVVHRPITAKAWQSYESEARKFIIATRTMETWSRTLSMFRAIAPHDDAFGLA